MAAKVHNKKDGLVSKIIENIQCGIYEVGSKFQSEQKISEQFKLSRTITRRAFLDLIKMGILTRKAGCGSFISLDALQIIESQQSNASLQVVVLFEANQIENPIIRHIFTTFLDNIDESINVKFDFFDYNIESNIEALKTDVAIVVGNKYNDNILSKIRNRVKELVLVNCNNPEFNFIAPDNHAGGCLMAEHLIEMGHRNVGCFYFLQENLHDEFNERFEGASLMFREHGLPLVAPPPLPRRNMLPQEVYLNLLDYLQQVCPDMTGVICLKDETALSLYDLFRQRGIMVPDDMSVIGFDDQLYSRMVEPALTTVKYPIEAIGLKLAEAIEHIAQHGSIEIQEKIVPVLLKRYSVKNINGEKK